MAEELVLIFDPIRDRRGVFCQGLILRAAAFLVLAVRITKKTSAWGSTEKFPADFACLRARTSVRSVCMHSLLSLTVQHISAQRRSLCPCVLTSLVADWSILDWMPEIFSSLSLLKDFFECFLERFETRER